MAEKNKKSWKQGKPRVRSPRTTAPEASPPTDNMDSDRSKWRSKIKKPNTKRPKASGKIYLDGVKPQRWRTRVYWLKLGGLLVASLALFIALLVYLIYEPSGVQLAYVSMPPRESPWLPLGYTTEDSQLIQQLSANENLRVQSLMAATGDAKQSLDAVVNSARKLKPYGPSNSIVLLLSAQGVVDERRQPCLIPPQANPLDSTSWLTMREVLDELGQLPSFQDPSVTKLLVLDSGDIHELWEAGIVANDFPAEFVKLVQQTQIPNLYVLHSRGTNELSWRAPEMNGSVFTHFVTRGINGEADLNGNHLVSLVELEDYARHHVSTWAKLFRASSQHPELIRSAATTEHDRELCHRNYYSASEPIVSSSDEFPELAVLGRDNRADSILALWQTRDKLAESPGATQRPVR